MKYKWLIAVGFVAVVGLLIWVNLRNAGDAKPASAGQGPKTAPQVKVMTVKPRNLTQTVLAPGTLEVLGSREVRAPFATLRVHLNVGAGDRVKAGQTLAELEADDMRVQVASQEAAVARSESALAQLNQQRESSPLLLQQKLETAKAQLAQAQSALETAARGSASAKQRLDQAQANLLAIQNRTAASPDEVGAARQTLQKAEADFRANPLSAAAGQAYDAARAAYESALRRSADAARQAAADLAQARQGLDIAQADVATSGDDSASVRQARQAVESARLSVELAQKDVESGGSLLDQIRSAEADLAAARATLANSQSKLDQAVIKAPQDGVVLSTGLKDGQPAQQGQLILELGGLDRLTVKARVDEVDIGKVQPGQALTLKSNAYLAEKFAGTVTRVAAQSIAPDPRTGASSAGTTYEVQGDVQNRDGKLKGGMSAQASIVTETRTGVFVVGLESLREEGDKAYVLVARDFKVELREVKLGLRTQTQVQILEGLKEGEKVVASPFTFVRSAKDGEAIRIDPAEAVLPQEEQS